MSTCLSSKCLYLPPHCSAWLWQMTGDSRKLTEIIINDSDFVRCLLFFTLSGKNVMSWQADKEVYKAIKIKSNLARDFCRLHGITGDISEICSSSIVADISDVARGSLYASNSVRQLFSNQEHHQCPWASRWWWGSEKIREENTGNYIEIQFHSLLSES